MTSSNIWNGKSLDSLHKVYYNFYFSNKQLGIFLNHRLNSYSLQIQIKTFKPFSIDLKVVVRLFYCSNLFHPSVAELTVGLTSISI